MWLPCPRHIGHHPCHLLSEPQPCVQVIYILSLSLRVAILCWIRRLELGIATMRCSILSHNACTWWWSWSRCCSSATDCLTILAWKTLPTYASDARWAIYGQLDTYWECPPNQTKPKMFGKHLNFMQGKSYCRSCLCLSKELFPFDHLVVEFDGLVAQWLLWNAQRRRWRQCKT